LPKNAPARKARVMDMVGLYLLERAYKNTTPTQALINILTPSLNLAIHHLIIIYTTW